MVMGVLKFDAVVADVKIMEAVTNQIKTMLAPESEKKTMQQQLCQSGPREIHDLLYFGF
jgi:hypothetical protein